MKYYYSIVAFLVLLCCQAQVSLSQAEYFWDTDPGEGNGTVVLAVDGNFDSAFEKLSNSGITAPSVGNHKFSIRIKDNTGVWGPTFTNTVIVEQNATPTPISLLQAEYFWDTDPGEGNGTVVLAIDGNFDSAFEKLSNSGIAAPSVGNHKFSIRIKDNTGVWGPIFTNMVVVEQNATPTPISLSQAEYFWDTDPGEGNGTVVLAIDGNFDSAFEKLSNSGIAAPSVGNHKFSIRIKDNLGVWGPTFTNMVIVEQNATPIPISLSQAEYFWDNDPGEGNGTVVLAVDGNFDSAFEKLSNTGIAAPSVGNHKFSIRIKDNTGVWGPTFTNMVIVEQNATPTPISLSQAEYFWDTDPGEGNGTVVLAVDGNFDSAFEKLSNSGIAAPSVGNHKFSIRIKDNTGVWGPTFTNIVIVEQNATPTPISLSQAEYFWDTDPGEGNGTILLATDGNFNAAFETVFQNGIAIAQPVGLHIFNVRIKDNKGSWSPVFKNAIYIETTICNTAQPTASTTQNVCNAGTVANLTASGTNLKWYSTATGGTVLVSTTPLSSSNYFVSQTIGTCESTRLSVSVTVNSSVTPTFDQVAPICSGASLAALPTTSNNAITGTWSPALNNTATTTYTFTPTVGLCATSTTMTITVNPNGTPEFAQVAPICAGSSLSALPTTSDLGISGTWSPSLNNAATTSYTFIPTVGLCATSTTMTITVNPNVTPEFAQVAPICSGASLSALPTTSNNGLTGTWSPALNNSATTTYTFTPTVGLCATSTTMTITVNPNVTPEFAEVAPICSGASLVALPTTSDLGFTGTWSPALDNSATTTYTFTPESSQCATSNTMTITVNPNVTPEFAQVTPICAGAILNALPTTSNNGLTGTWSPSLNNAATTSYTFIPTVGLCVTSTTMTITVNPNVTPEFAEVAPICSGASLSALPTTSNNGLTGTWSPALNNSATTTYTFTPTVGLCATSTTMTITVNPNVTPEFAQVAPICSGASLVALPTTSDLGITGTWSPALNNSATTTYTFTPESSQCATSATMTITVNPNVTPMFTQVAPICSGGFLAALPTTSNNGLTGTWSPAIDIVATTTYTFTPESSQCATSTTMTITVNPNVTPEFAQVAPICTGASLLALSTTSNNGLTGTWSPALNNIATTTYTFTSTTGLCSTSTTMTITVNPNVTPEFAQVAPICSGAILLALPTTSNNAITGTWSPALDNSATTTYTFTPTAGLCAASTTMTITVNPNVTPEFAQVAPICSGASLSALPTTSDLGISGTWSPALDNSATTTYTFTPNTGLCATSTTMTITVNPNVTPEFAQVAPICAGGFLAALPTISNNSISGTWSPALDNSATTTYTFTPTAGLCAASTTMTITVNPNVTPEFTQVAPICSGASLSALPTTSDLGISGTWSPAVDNTTTTTYTFTPTVGLCATTTTMTITVNPNVTSEFTQVTPICSGSSLAALPTTSDLGITGAWSPALDNSATTTYTFIPTTGLCATSTTMTITVNPNVTPEFAQVAPICSGASLAALPTTSDLGIIGTWSPALNNAATTTYTFTPTAGLCATSTTMTITVNPNITPTFSQVAPICSGASLAVLPTTSNNGFTGTWSPALDNSATTTYTFTSESSQCATTASMTIIVNPNITPEFAQVAPICAGSSLSALPTNSNNAIAGTWSPALDNSATTTYTFIPTTGLCATSTTMTITVNPNVTPEFAQVAPICSGASLAALPTTSDLGISGTWSPAINNALTTTYTFTPESSQCATNATMTITVNPNVTPEFAQVAPICAGASLVALPTTSNNGLIGTWSPALDNSATTTYTFTPATGLCATSTTMTITVNPNVTPEFAQVAPICSGASLAALPTTSNNGLTGTWSPALNNSATTTYTFTPNTGLCATSTTMTITINPNVTPEFAQVAPICSGASLSALPTTLNNGLTGTWSPIIDNTATTTYTFTPESSQCATTATMTITVNPNVTPEFAQVAPICAGASLVALPTTSNNGLIGTWSPTLNNAATTTYTFTPTAGLCATSTTMTITVNPNITPTFTQVTPICSGASLAALPTTSNNGLTGTWSPALNNSATTTYTFTPNTGLCATSTTMTITINPNVTPEFAQVAPICSGASLSALPTTSNNGLTGTWSPVLNNAATTTYTFTPTAGLCATIATMTITVNPFVFPTFTQVAPICSGASLAALPTTSNNGFTGTWSPTLNNTSTTTYTFVPTTGLCAFSKTMTITVNPNISLSFNGVTPICSGASLSALPTTSNNGYTGTWSPALDNTNTTTYTFTPTAGFCALATSLTITVFPNVTYYADMDLDGYGNPAVSQVSCTGAPNGYVSNNLDCNDSNSAIHPGAEEICGDAIDNDCNGLIDETCHTEINSVFWNTTLAGLDTNILAIAYPGAQMYRFEVKNGTTLIGTYDISSATPNNFALAKLAGINYSTTYSIRVALKLYGTWGYYGNAHNVTTPALSVNTVLVTTIHTSFCGATLTDLNTKILAAAILNATGYRFEISYGGVTKFYNSTTYNFTLAQAGVAAYGTTFTIRVAVIVNGIYGNYGASCNVYSPALTSNNISTTAIMPSFCGATITALDTKIPASIVSGASGYRFEITNGGTTVVYNSPTYNFMLSQTGITVSYGTTYSIRVAAIASGIYGNYGATCTVSTPILTSNTVPTTKVATVYCGTTLATLDTKIGADIVSGASGYRFEIVKGGVTTIYNSTTYNFKLSQTGVVVANGTTYVIRVAALINGIYGNYGTSCTITTPAAAVVRLKAKTFEVSAYPNPFETAFNLNLETSSKEDVTIVVYDMIGKLIETRKVNPTEVDKLQIGNNFAAGIYNIIVSQDNDIKAIRLIRK